MSNLFEKQIPLMKPFLNSEEFEPLREVLLSGWVSQGPKVAEFEEAIANFVGAKYGVATNACTSAIHLAFRIQGVKEGDEVILANTTCMANVNAIVMAGAKPIFVDIDEKTFNLNPKLIEEKITEKTSAILIIDQIGLAADLDAIKTIANEHNLILVDDAATALGGKYKGKYLGNHDLVTTFSFHPRKMITTGEGGMLMTNSLEIAEKAKILRATGASVSDLDRHKAKGVVLQKYYESGYNYRMTDIQATIGLAQIKKLDYIIAERKRQAEIFNAAFEKINGLIIPFVPEYAEHAYSSYMLKIEANFPITATEVLQIMAQKGISCRYGIQPLHREPYFDSQGLTDDLYPVSVSLAEKSFFIPIFPGLTDGEINYIIESISEIFRG